MRASCSHRHAKTAPDQDLSAGFRLQSSTSDAEAAERDALFQATLVRKVHKGLLWKFVVLAILCYIDRTSLSFASPSLVKDLGFSNEQYGLGAGLFFVGYVLVQVPSNLILVRVGARIWLSSLGIAWGLVAAQFAFMKSAAAFYGWRIALGFVEAGTMPGIWYTCSLFYGPDELTMAWSYMLLGIAFSQVAGGPLASALLRLDGVLGLHGWQWLFLVEAAATVLYGLYCLASLTDGPASATFLTPAERAWLLERNAKRNEEQNASGMKESIKTAVSDYRTWHLTMMMTTSNIPKWAIMYWCPLIVNKLLGASETYQPNTSLVALLSGLPFAASAVFVILTSRHSEKTGERRWHTAIPLSFAGLALLVLAAAMHFNLTGLAFPALLFCTSVWAPDAVMASWPATFLHATAAATGSATINSVGSLGGFLGPYLTGLLEDKFGGFTVAVCVLAAATFMDAGLAACFPRAKKAAVGADEKEETRGFLGEVGGSGRQTGDEQTDV